MNKQRFTNLLILPSLAVVLLLSLVSCETPATLDNADKIHADAIVVDTHNDTMTRLLTEDDWLPKLDLNQDLSEKTRHGHIDIPKLIEGGIDVPFFAAFTTPYTFRGRVLDRALALMNCLYWQIERNSDIMELVESYEDIERIVNEGKIAAVLSVEGAYAVKPPHGRELLHQYNDLGVKALSFTWNYSNELAEGIYSHDVDYNLSTPGLTEYGKEMLEELNRLGIVADVSHLHESSFWDIVELSEAPVMASHSSVYALQIHERNLKDDQLIALAENGGVIQITFVPRFLGEGGNLKSIVDHIDYAVDLIGIEHVGLGSDFDGTVTHEDMADASHFPKITEELIRRGYSRDEIEKILGGNTLRVMKEAEEIGRKLRKAAGEEDPADFPFSVIPELQMGEIIDESTPLLKAELEPAVGADMHQLAFRIILDGKVYTPEFDPSTYEISYQLEEPLEKGFHLLTFEVTGDNGKERSTIIFHRKH